MKILKIICALISLLFILFSFNLTGRAFQNGLLENGSPYYVESIFSKIQVLWGYTFPALYCLSVLKYHKLALAVLIAFYYLPFNFVLGSYSHEYPAYRLDASSIIILLFLCLIFTVTLWHTFIAKKLLTTDSTLSTEGAPPVEK